MSDKEIELVKKGVLDEEINIDFNNAFNSELKPVSLKTLFFSLSSMKEQIMFFMGFFCRRFYISLYSL